ncbi:cupin domain-containing protein [Sinorhizobium terangae]|uniref:Cupin domain-containing protein n=1 Tax=Sinorhizobium terangae TaxID=110322 RepID=A0A6N7LBZ3_SINTE|nr:cupin domain-containing protein [Sinorhizobium terangae]MBB4189666.1 quercetin dioxygenase-like cupin family protein [Sinorhizobium terangae]MQX15377.1 cupin domain-containing protein [Sinorhizobium terangae]WFU49524.1 cupin domain-containing protein [Sinorhizobium terangae]
MFRPIAAAFSFALITAAPALADEPYNAKITTVFDQKLPHVPGKSMRGVLVEYGPGGHNPSHTHAKSAFIYATVIEGRIKSQVNGGEVKIYNTGENWVESPGDHHQVSANASDTKDAKILAVFVVDTDETELTIPDD